MPLALSDNQLDLVMRASIRPGRRPAAHSRRPLCQRCRRGARDQGRMPVCVLLLPSWTKVTFTEGLELDLKTVSRHREHSAKVTI